MILFNYILMCLIFGTTFLAIKIGVDSGAPPFFSAGARFLIAGAVLFLWMLWKKKAKLSILFKKEMIITGTGLTFGTFATLYWAEQYVSSGIAAVLAATGPIMILLLQGVFLRQKTPVLSLVGGFVGFCGVFLLLLPSLYLNVNRLWLIGCIVILFGELIYSGGAIYSKKVINQFVGVSSVALNAVQMLYGGVMLILLSLFTEKIDLQVLVQDEIILSMLYLVIVGSMIGQTLFYWLVGKTNPVFPSTWLYVSPLIALALGVMFYKEKISSLGILGGIVIIIGILLVNSESLKILADKWRMKNEVLEKTQ